MKAKAVFMGLTDLDAMIRAVEESDNLEDKVIILTFDSTEQIREVLASGSVEFQLGGA